MPSVFYPVLFREPGCFPLFAIEFKFQEPSVTGEAVHVCRKKTINDHLVIFTFWLSACTALNFLLQVRMLYPLL